MARSRFFIDDLRQPMPVKSQRDCAAEMPGPPFFPSYDLKGLI
ncbi:hypothetical protein CEV34_1620 [Brucella pseudogrignonensis]|uniref:Uncharacterized protein n=1 Tax=Brucella pseudogrignonensis TaxID=419475 RepID=A0A256GL55_9HYPH|nr:hypothetical protein CEV34_1620 [Brucella pseudogrignonensis]